MALRSDPLDVIRDALTAAGCDPKGSQRLSAKCPAHADSNPSLSVTRGTHQPIVLRCHAGCEPDAIIDALRLDWSDLCEPDVDYERPATKRVSEVYRYADEHGVVLFEVVRYDPKGFAQRQPDGTWGLNGARRVPYRLAMVIGAVANGETVYVVEGEKDVHAIEREGCVATCNPGGAGKWRDEYDEFFVGAKVVIVADDDVVGHRHAHDVERHLLAVNAVVTLKLPALGAKDVAEHLGLGQGLDDLRPFTDSFAENGQQPTQAEAKLEWNVPVPLGYPTRPPVFPAHRFPPYLNEYAVDVAHAMQTPVDLPAMLILSTLAAACGGHVRVRVRPGWEEPLNLYTATAMLPGERKTPVFLRLTKPLSDAEDQLLALVKASINDAKVNKAVHEAAAIKALAEAERAKEETKETAMKYAVAMANEADAIEMPVMPRILADDITPETLASLMAEQGGQISIFSDEGEVFPMMAGRYGKGANLGVYLKAHVGSKILVDRKGREPEKIARPALTMGLTVQPEVLRQLSLIDGARGRGLLGRFLWSVPVSYVGDRDVAATPVSEAIEAQYGEEIRLIVRSLWDYRYDAAMDTTMVIPFSPEGDLALRRFERMIEPRLRASDGDLAHISDWATKLAGHVARIAGLLHVATHIRHGWRSDISASIVDDAIAIAEYLIDHALMAFDVMAADVELDDARALLRWVAKQDGFSRREAQQALRGRSLKVEQVAEALGRLEDHGYIRRLPAPPKTTRGGRPPGPRYEVHPDCEF
jgi:putative DNA primase/helicase